MSDQIDGSEQVITPATTATSANGGAEQQPEAVKTFNQDDVNAIAGRARTEALERFAKEYGLDGVEELQNAIKAKQEAEDAAKTELEKAIEARQRAETKAEKATQQAKDALIKGAFLAEAGKMQAQHPQDAYRLADLSDVKVGDDGEIVGVDEAVVALVESGRLATVGKPIAPKLNGGAGSGERPGDKAIQLTPEEVAQARKMNISLEDYQKNKSS